MFPREIRYNNKLKSADNNPELISVKVIDRYRSRDINNFINSYRVTRKKKRNFILLLKTSQKRSEKY